MHLFNEHKQTPMIRRALLPAKKMVFGHVKHEMGAIPMFNTQILKPPFTFKKNSRWSMFLLKKTKYYMVYFTIPIYFMLKYTYITRSSCLEIGDCGVRDPIFL